MGYSIPVRTHAAGMHLCTPLAHHYTHQRGGAFAGTIPKQFGYLGFWRAIAEDEKHTGYTHKSHDLMHFGWYRGVADAYGNGAAAGGFDPQRPRYAWAVCAAALLRLRWLRQAGADLLGSHGLVEVAARSLAEGTHHAAHVLFAGGAELGNGLLDELDQGVAGHLRGQ